MSTTSDSASTNDIELTVSRTLDAPRDLVFKAWTEPARLEKWWSPVLEADVRPGGQWRAQAATPDGTGNWSHGDYREIVPPERIVYTYRGKIPGSDELTATVTFEEDGGKTRMFFRMSGFGSKEARDGHRGGFTECLNALEASLTGDRNPRIHHAS